MSFKLEIVNVTVSGPEPEGPAQTRKSPIPVPPIPDLAGNRDTGNPRFPIWPGIAGDTGNPRFPIRPARGIGNRGPDSPQIGKSGMPLCVSTSCTILGWMLP